jgi:hypothetical protein
MMLDRRVPVYGGRIGFKPGIILHDTCRIAFVSRLGFHSNIQRRVFTEIREGIAYHPTGLKKVRMSASFRRKPESGSMTREIPTFVGTTRQIRTGR